MSSLCARHMLSGSTRCSRGQPRLCTATVSSRHRLPLAMDWQASAIAAQKETCSRRQSRAVCVPRSYYRPIHCLAGTQKPCGTPSQRSGPANAKPITSSSLSCHSCATRSHRCLRSIEQRAPSHGTDRPRCRKYSAQAKCADRPILIRSTCRAAHAGGAQSGRLWFCSAPRKFGTCS